MSAIPYQRRDLPRRRRGTKAKFGGTIRKFTLPGISQDAIELGQRKPPLRYPSDHITSQSDFEIEKKNDAKKFPRHPITSPILLPRFLRNAVVSIHQINDESLLTQHILSGTPRAITKGKENLGDPRVVHLTAGIETFSAHLACPSSTEIHVLGIVALKKIRVDSQRRATAKAR